MNAREKRGVTKTRNGQRGMGSGKRARGTGKIGTKPNLDPRNIRNFIFHSLFVPIFDFPVPRARSRSPFPVLVTSGKNSHASMEHLVKMASKTLMHGVYLKSCLYTLSRSEIKRSLIIKNV